MDWGTGVAGAEAVSQKYLLEINQLHIRNKVSFWRKFHLRPHQNLPDLF